MPFPVTCSCGQRFIAEDHIEGRLVRCLSCRRPLRVERATASTKLVVHCKCGQSFQVAAELRGKDVACPSCLAVQKAEELSAPQSEAADLDPLWDSPLMVAAPRESSLDSGPVTSAFRYQLPSKPARLEADFQKTLRRAIWTASIVSGLAIAFGVIYCIVIPGANVLRQQWGDAQPNPEFEVAEVEDRSGEAAAPGTAEDPLPPVERVDGPIRPASTPRPTPTPTPSPPPSFANPTARTEVPEAVERVAPVRRRDEEQPAEQRASLSESLVNWHRSAGRKRGLRRADRTDYPIYQYGWLCDMLPYIDRQELYDRLNFQKPYSDSSNIPVALTVVPKFLNPGDGRRRWEGIYYRGFGVSHFVGMSGIEDSRNVVAAELPRTDPRAGVFGYERVASQEDIGDGTSNTLMIVGSGELAGPWIMGGGATIRGARRPYFDRTTGLGTRPGRHGSIVIMADGSTRFISGNVDETVFRAMCTINGGETVDVMGHSSPADLDSQE